MKLARLLLVAGVVGAGGAAVSEEYTAYMAQFGKIYSGGDLAMRQGLYEAAARKAASGDARYTRGLNRFSDWTPEEYKTLFGLDKSRLLAREHPRRAAGFRPAEPAAQAFPESWDWVAKGAITKPRNQGNCGSCWSFAGTEAISAALFLSSGKLVELSPQAFVDCVPNPKKCGGAGGCEGATYDLLYEYANNTHGAVRDIDYPYTGKDGTCHLSGVPAFAHIGGWVDVEPNNYDALMNALMVTPVAVGVAAMNWGDYMGGVYPAELCDADIDHAVLLVGWGTDPGLGDYWKIKNSWGVDWGEDGYIRLQKRPTFCNVDTRPSDGLGCAGGPANVTVCGACAIQAAPSYPTGVKLAV